MAKTVNLLLLPGDGIGVEVTVQAVRIIEWLEKNRGVSFKLTEALAGGACIDKHGVPILDETVEIGKKADAVFLGAVGGPKWDALPFDKRPERALLRMRKDLDLFANIRPAFLFKPLVGASTLKEEVVSGLDLVVLRELTGGVYFGTPRGIETLPNGERKGVNTQAYTTGEIRRIARVGFDLARKRRKLVHSAEKSNVMESGRLWREEVQWVHDNEGYSDVALDHILADNCCMQLLRWPKQFDVIVTDNLFGDLMSDIAAMLTGSLGMLPSASLGERDATGHQCAMYEPVHGTAPDIAGKDLANPLAAILSFTMALRFSLNMEADADLIEKAVAAVLDKGYRTGDLAALPGDNVKKVGCSGMGDAILRELDRLAA